MRKQDSWKKSASAFEPFQTNYRELCGFADHIVGAAQGFGMHSHQNMEITTIVLSGKQARKSQFPPSPISTFYVSSKLNTYLWGSNIKLKLFKIQL